MKEKCMERSQVPRARAAVCEQEEMFLIPVRVYIYDREREMVTCGVIHVS